MPEEVKSSAPAPQVRRATPVVEYKPTLGVRQEQIAAVLKETAPAQESSTPANAPVPTPTTPAAEAKPAETPAAAEDPAFQKLLRDRAALRQEAEALKPYREASKLIDAQTLQAIAKAKAAHDPQAALAALGFKIESPTKAKPAEEPEIPEYVREMKAELESLKAERAEVRANRARKEVVERTREAIKEADFPLVSTLGEHDMVVNMLENYYTMHQSLPAETFEESVKVVAKEVERILGAQKQKWAKVLTSAPPAETMPTSSPESAGKSLSNALSAPRAVAAAPQSREEKIAALLKDPELDKLFSND